jgi:hypothetical protein
MKGVHNVFTKVKESLGHYLVGVGCSAHVIHNALPTSTDMPPVHIKGSDSKIYSCFYFYIIRVENVKEFCEIVNQDYKKMLGYRKTRWPALFPAVEQFLNMFLLLKSFFES